MMMMTMMWEIHHDINRTLDIVCRCKLCRMSLSLVSRWQSASLRYRHVLSTSLTRSPTVFTQLPHRHWRNYASKNKVKSTASFIPGSKQPITDKAAQEEYAKAENAMRVAVDWFRKECAASEARALGRITPALLSPVRVKIPGMEKSLHLEEVATVGVREGTTLLVTLFDEHNIKYVEAALYESGIPGVVPHRVDNRTIKVPIPKTTIEAKKQVYASAKRKGEEIRVQIRSKHSASLKRGKYGKHSIELEEFQKLNDKYIAAVDKILLDLQKATSS